MEENTRKRKINDPDLSRHRRIPPPGEEINGRDDFLSLSSPAYSFTTTPPHVVRHHQQQQQQQQQIHQFQNPNYYPNQPLFSGGFIPNFEPVVPNNPLLPSPPPAPQSIAARAPRVRRRPNQSHGPGKTPTVPAPFPWATVHRATVHTLDYMLSKDIRSITGDVHCKKCDRRYAMEFDLRDKFRKIATFVATEKDHMLDRAPERWSNPTLPDCRFCQAKNCVRPVISEKKRSVNWLFLLLGEFLGCCTLEQLKYFCKHTKNHRTGAKDRVLFLTYLAMCKQVDPNGPFDHR